MPNDIQTGGSGANLARAFAGLLLVAGFGALIYNLRPAFYDWTHPWEPTFRGISLAISIWCAAPLAFALAVARRVCGPGAGTAPPSRWLATPFALLYLWGWHLFMDAYWIPKWVNPVSLKIVMASMDLSYFAVFWIAHATRVASGAACWVALTADHYLLFAMFIAFGLPMRIGPGDSLALFVALQWLIRGFIVLSLLLYAKARAAGEAKDLGLFEFAWLVALAWQRRYTGPQARAFLSNRDDRELLKRSPAAAL